MNVSMLLNIAIFTAVVTEAKAKAANSPVWLRAIDRAVVELNRASYWSFVDGVLVLISTTSKKRYVIDATHTCEARNGRCKHIAAHRLMTRYVEALTSVPAAATAEQPSALVPAATQIPARAEHVCKLCSEPLKDATLEVHTKCVLYRNRRDEVADLPNSAVTAKSSPATPAVTAPRPTPTAEGVMWYRTIKGEKYGGVDI